MAKYVKILLPESEKLLNQCHFLTMNLVTVDQCHFLTMKLVNVNLAIIIDGQRCPKWYESVMTLFLRVVGYGAILTKKPKTSTILWYRPIHFWDGLTRLWGDTELGCGIWWYRSIDGWGGLTRLWGDTIG